MVIGLLTLIAVLLIVGIIEFKIHKNNLNKIPIRIHVNGSRGKWSVVRLIASGLRFGGLRTFAKTTTRNLKIFWYIELCF